MSKGKHFIILNETLFVFEKLVSFGIKNSDLLGEILLCFRLCFFNDNNIYLNIYNILAKVPTNNINFHLNTVLAIPSYPFNFKNKFNLLRDILKLLIVLFIIMLILKKKNNKT